MDKNYLYTLLCEALGVLEAARIDTDIERVKRGVSEALTLLRNDILLEVLNG